MHEPFASLDIKRLSQGEVACVWAPTTTEEHDLVVTELGGHPDGIAYKATSTSDAYDHEIEENGAKPIPC